MWAKIPVRLRLSLAHAIWMGGLFLMLGVGLTSVLEHNLLKSVDAALLLSAKNINSNRNFRQGFPNHQLLSNLLNNNFAFSGSMPDILKSLLNDRFVIPYAQIIDLTGQISAKSDVHVRLPISSTSLKRAEKGAITYENLKIDDSLYRQITLPITVNGLFSGEIIQVATSLEPLQHTLRGVSLVLWTAFPIGLLISVIFGYWLTGRSLKPVRLISQAAEKLGVDQLGTTLAIPTANDELGELTKTFNHMLLRLEDSFKRMRYFSSNVSHELRTPLAVMRAEAELSLRKPRQPEEYQDALKRIVQEVGGMTVLIEDLLLLAKAQSGAVAVSWQKISTAEFIKDLHHSLDPFFSKKNVKFTSQVNSVPFLYGTPTYLFIAFKNLLLNAIKHAPQDSVVTLDIWADSHNIMAKVIDYGDGIPEEAQKYIFDPFYRVESDRNRQKGGVGIGLTLTDALIKLHHGAISVYSVVNKTTEFTIKLPKGIPEVLPLH